MKYFQITALLLCSLILAGCAKTIENRTPLEQSFPMVSGTDLNKKPVTLPVDVKGEISLFLIGYVQDSQFDIDRWLIGLDMTKTQVAAYELPTISGMFPRMFRTYIDNGMRRGIPKDLWRGVITIYDDADKIQTLTGTENPNNARVLLVDEQGKIIYFYDRGFSVNALNRLRSTLGKQMALNQNQTDSYSK